MANYTVRQASIALNIPKDTLRYYDKLHLVSPMRGENGYRLYTEEDITQLKYVYVMKYAGFSLDEIKTLFQSKGRIGAKDFKDTVLALLHAKETQTMSRIAHLTKIRALILTSIDTISGKEPDDKETADKLVREIFSDITTGYSHIETAT
jgi:DNA-binding transcriptional MerR regulator